MGAPATFVIVGAGLTGAKAAETLRSAGFDGRVVLVGAEDERPYERPPLSKDYLRGETDAKPYVHDEGFYAAQDIELLTGTRVEAIVPAESRVTLAGGAQLAYDRLLLATGAEPRRLPLPGAELDGVVTLRDVADADALRQRLAPGVRLVTIGAGWIGSEVAASARARGCEVTILDLAPLPLERVLGAQVGTIYRNIHAEHGVTFLGGVGIEAIEGDDRVTGVRLADGRVVGADVVLVGVGVQPRTELAAAAGLEVDGGIVTDAHLRTSVPTIHAAGDVAHAYHPFYGTWVRLEHWDNAIRQGAAAAHAMLGGGEDYDHLPYFFSDQYEVGMEYSGRGTGSDEVVLRGDVDRHEFLAFWLHDGRVVAGMNLNVWDVHDDIRGLIRSRASVDAARLTDGDTPLAEVAVA